MAIARKKMAVEDYSAAILPYLKAGYWVAQDKNGDTFAYFGDCTPMKNYWLGPFAKVLKNFPRCEQGWMESLRQPKIRRQWNASR